MTKDESAPATTRSAKRKRDSAASAAKGAKVEKEAKDESVEPTDGSSASEEKQEAADADGKQDHHEYLDAANKSGSEPQAKVAKTSTPLDWLLSDEAFNMANPEIPEGHGEIDWEDGPHKKSPPANSAGKASSDDDTKPVDILRYPQSPLTPFQNLVAACLLSKPFSHRLGLRTIQTLLNPPFGLRTVADLDEAGYEGRRKVMWEARTQHKEKTAAQLGDLVEGVKELCGNSADEEDLSELQGLKGELKGLSPADAQEKVKEILTKIKGIGPGVVGIFLRRIQGDWEEVFPYADERSLGAAKRFDLIGEGEGAEELAEKVGGDRGKLVRLLDTLIGLDLEKVLDDAVAKSQS